MHAVREPCPRLIRKAPNAEPRLFDHSFIPFMIVIVSPIIVSPPPQKLLAPPRIMQRTS